MILSFRILQRWRTIGGGEKFAKRTRRHGVACTLKTGGPSHSIFSRSTPRPPVLSLSLRDQNGEQQSVSNTDHSVGLLIADKLSSEGPTRRPDRFAVYVMQWYIGRSSNTTTGRTKWV